MNPHDRSRPRPRIRWFEIVLLGVVLLVLAALAVPSVNTVGGSAASRRVGTLNNARQLQIATLTMTLETQESRGPGMEWTGVIIDAEGGRRPATLADYLRQLIDHNYLTEQDVRQILSAPGRRPGQQPITAENIAFRIFSFDDGAPGDQPFVVTANWRAGRLTDEAPFGRGVFVTMNKAGHGGVYRGGAEAGSRQLFPRGPRYRSDTLR